MSKAFEEIAREASQLSRKQQIELAELLLEMTDIQETDAGSAWEQEILARIQAVDEGHAGVAYEDLMRDAEERLSS